MYKKFTISDILTNEHGSLHLVELTSIDETIVFCWPYYSFYNYVDKDFCCQGPKYVINFDLEDGQIIVWDVYKSKDLSQKYSFPYIQRQGL